MSALTIELDGSVAGGAGAADLPELVATLGDEPSADRVEIGRDDVIGALRQADDVAGLRLGVDELALGIAAFGHVDRQRQLGRVDRRVGDRAVDPEAARGQGQPFGADLRAERQPAGSRSRDRRRRARHSRRAAGSGSAGRGWIRRSADARPPRRAARRTPASCRPPVSGAADAAVERSGEAQRRLSVRGRGIGVRGGAEHDHGDEGDDPCRNSQKGAHSPSLAAKSRPVHGAAASRGCPPRGRLVLPQ